MKPSPRKWFLRWSLHRGNGFCGEAFTAEITQKMSFKISAVKSSLGKQFSAVKASPKFRLCQGNNFCSEAYTTEKLVKFFCVISAVKSSPRKSFPRWSLHRRNHTKNEFQNFCSEVFTGEKIFCSEGFTREMISAVKPTPQRSWKSLFVLFPRKPILHRGNRGQNFWDLSWPLNE